jgi:hypothetical protein
LANTFAIAGYDDHYHREAPFSIGVSGIDSSQVECDARKCAMVEYRSFRFVSFRSLALQAKLIEQTIDDVLRRVAVDGFPRERIEATLHQIEVRENNNKFLCHCCF